MYRLPDRQQVFLPSFDQPDSPYRVARFHPVHLNEFYWPTCVAESDDYLRAALHHMNMRRAMLTWRQENTDRKAA